MTGFRVPCHHHDDVRLRGRVRHATLCVLCWSLPAISQDPQGFLEWLSFKLHTEDKACFQSQLNYLEHQSDCLAHKNHLI